MTQHAVALSHTRVFGPQLKSASTAQVALLTLLGSSQDRAGTLTAERLSVRAEPTAFIAAALHGTATVTRTGSPLQQTTTGCRGWRCPTFSWVRSSGTCLAQYATL